MTTAYSQIVLDYMGISDARQVNEEISPSHGEDIKQQTEFDEELAVTL